MMSGTNVATAVISDVTTAVIGDVVGRTISAALGRYEARASVDDQLQRLSTLVIMVHSAVEAAEGMHIRNWWLRRWLWNLRDAALDADEVLRLFRRRRAFEEAAAAATAAAGTQNRSTLWSAAWRALRSAKSLLFGGGDVDDGGAVDVERLSRMVERLEREAMGLGDFLKMLELEIRRSLPLQDSGPSIIEQQVRHASLVRRKDDDGAAGFESSEDDMIYQHRRQTIVRVEDDRLSYISHQEYVAGVRKMVLLILRRRIRRALDKLIPGRTPVAPPPAAWSRPPDPDRLRDMVARIRKAVVSADGSTGAEFHGGERLCWLALWHRELQAVADRAERALTPAVPGDDGGLRSSAPSVETAAAHLEDFVALVRLARRQMHTPWRHGGNRDIKVTRLWFLSGLIIVILTICLLVFKIKTILNR